MQKTSVAKIIPLALAMAGLSLGGCGLIGVDMTSTPATVRRGDPVTFDIKLTNHSQCPLETSFAILIPFISASDLDATFSSELSPDAPPEILQFIQQLRAFFDDLCTGGSPTPPVVPTLATGPAVTSGAMPNPISTGCHRVGGAIECEISGRVHGVGSGMTFSLLGDRLQCYVDDGIVRCMFQVELPQPAVPAAVTSAASQPLTCLTPEQLGVPEEEGIGGFCFLGSFPMFTGLGGGQMAEGQIVLPAHGAGVTRNLVIAVSPDVDDAGVCKGGASAGQACDRSDSTPCPGSTCGEGICVGGDNNGLGCDVAMQGTDCPKGGTCKACDDVPQTGFLPIDCTTTYVSPEPAPVMSMWGLMAMAVLLFVAGTLWLERRRELR